MPHSNMLRRVVIWIWIFAGFFMLAWLGQPASARSRSFGLLQVSFINVGQGDSILLRDSEGFDVLIDGGLASAGPTVVAYLKEQGVDDVDVMVASHADSDHTGGLVKVMQATDIPIEAFVYNGYPGTSQTWNNLWALAEARGLIPTAAAFPQAFTWGVSQVAVLNPPSGMTNPETNEASVVLRVQHGAVSYLFTGDIDNAVESDLLARQVKLDSNVLKVAHHGSKYSSSVNFLSAVLPGISVISVGKNSYGHPAEETLLRLEDSGTLVYRTDEVGTVVVVSDGETFTIPGGEEPEFITFLPVIQIEAPVP